MVEEVDVDQELVAARRVFLILAYLVRAEGVVLLVENLGCGMHEERAAEEVLGGEVGDGVRVMDEPELRHMFNEERSEVRVAAPRLAKGKQGVDSHADPELEVKGGKDCKDGTEAVARDVKGGGGVLLLVR